MAQYQVPQFIEVEDKIFGPLTLKQFIYLAGGGGLVLVCFSLLPLWLTVVIPIPVMSISAGLAFYQFNGRPLIHMLEHASAYFFGSKLYLWMQRQPTAGSQPAAGPAAKALMPVPKLSDSKLKDLSWSLNIKDRAGMGVTTQERSGFEI